MAERSPYLEPMNLGLAAALGVLVLAAGALALGPGRARVMDLRRELAQRQERVAEWERQHAGGHAVTSDERDRWTREWEWALAHVPPAVDDPELVARWARAFQAPSVSQLEIERVPPTRDAPPALRLAVASPLDDASAQLEGDPLRVRFRARYEDVARLLGELEAGRLPARVESLALSRVAPDVAVDLTLTVFARREVAS